MAGFDTSKLSEDVRGHYERGLQIVADEKKDSECVNYFPGYKSHTDPYAGIVICAEDGPIAERKFRTELEVWGHNLNRLPPAIAEECRVRVHRGLRAHIDRQPDPAFQEKYSAYTSPEVLHLQEHAAELNNKLAS